MSVKKVALLYFSPTGTTRSILTSIGTGTGLHCQHLDMTLLDARTKMCHISPDELLIIGFPVYGGRIPSIQKSILSQLPTGSNKAVPIVVYGNRAYDDALLELADLCQQKGYTLAGAGAFIGEHSYTNKMGNNRPDAKDKKLGEEFGRLLALSIELDKAFDCSVLPGNRPYKERSPKLPVVPSTSGDCIGCMICAKLCPVQAISLDDPNVIDPEKCILCAACVKHCPNQGKQILFPPLVERMEAMAIANAEPKEPDFFLPA